MAVAVTVQPTQHGCAPAQQNMCCAVTEQQWVRLRPVEGVGRHAIPSESPCRSAMENVECSHSS
jgi:hypothetical protein